MLAETDDGVRKWLEETLTNQFENSGVRRRGLFLTEN